MVIDALSEGLYALFDGKVDAHRRHANPEATHGMLEFGEEADGDDFVVLTAALALG